MSLVTIAIPTLYSGPTLSACLRALNGQIAEDFEVVVINNGGQTLETPSSLRYRVTVLHPGRNTGFGAAINLALQSTTSPFLATLNDDTEPDPEWLSALLTEMSRDEQIGMCASRIRYFESNRLDSAGMLICLDGSSKQRGGNRPASDFGEPEDVLLPSACAALYRRAMMDEIGGFDEDYYLYCEDTDIGLRARWAGWRCRYAPQATVRHHYSVSAGAYSPLKANLVERNRLWVAIKNFPLAILVFSPIISVSRYLWQLASLRGKTSAAARFVSSGASLGGAFSILLNAHTETLRSLPSLIRKRIAIRRTRRISAFEFARIVFRYRISARNIAAS